MLDLKTAMVEAERVKKFPYAVEAYVYRDDVMVAAILYSPQSKGKGEKWRT
jgi:hypothetical protein